jgi:hypothetical protein
MYPLALEGALKLKEISYIHAEGYASGELKHGPIALIDAKVPVIVLAPRDALFDKTVSNMQEVMARHGKVLLISDAAGIRRQRIGLQAVRYAVRPGRRDVKLPLCDRGGGGERQRLGVLISQRDAGEPRELDERRALVGLWRGGLHERSQLHDDHDHARHRNTYLGVWRL